MLKQILLAIILALYFGVFILVDHRIRLANDRMGVQHKALQRHVKQDYDVFCIIQVSIMELKRQIDALEVRIEELEDK